MDSMALRVLLIICFVGGAIDTQAQQRDPAWELAAQRPILLNAEQMRFDEQKQLVEASGDVSLTYDDIQIHADRIKYCIKKQEARLSGDVKIKGTDISLQGDSLQVDLKTGTWVVDNGRFNLKIGRHQKPSTYFVEGTQIRKIAASRWIADDVVFTTCTCPNGSPDWIIRAKQVDLDPKSGAWLHSPTFELESFHVPLLRPPLMYLPMGERRSGFLFPELGYSGRDGIRGRGSFFWAISRSFDSTIGLMGIQQRGVMPDLELRYDLGGASQGNFRGAWLYDLKEGDIHRFGSSWKWAVSSQSARLYSSGMLLSDSQYLRDFGGTLQAISQPYTTTNVGISSSWDQLYLGLYIRYFQDISRASSYERGTHRELNLFDASQQSVVHILPAARLWMQKQTLYSLVTWTLDSQVLNYSNIGPVWQDLGQDGRSNGAFDPDEQPLQLTKITLLPEIAIPFSIVGVLNVYPFVKVYSDMVIGREVPLNIDKKSRSDLLWQNSLTVVSGGDLWTRLYRVYDETVRHDVTLKLNYRIVPHSATNTFRRMQRPLYDRTDTIRQTQRLTLGLTNDIITKQNDQGYRSSQRYHHLLSFSLAQDFELGFGEVSPRVGSFLADLILDLDIFRLNATASLSMTDPAITDAFAGVHTNITEYVELFGQLISLDPEVDGRYYLDDTRSYDFYGARGRYLALSPLFQVSAGANIKFCSIIRTHHQATYGIKMEKLLYTQNGIIFSSKCNCWQLNLFARTFADQIYPDVFMTFDLTKLAN